MEVTTRVRDLCEPVAADLGLELYDVERAGGMLRITIDRAGGLPLDDLAEATRRISRLLDEHDPVPGTYTLEVTSPGLERNLRTPEHFARSIGDLVSVRVRIPGEGAERVRGTIVGVDADGITLQTDDASRRTIGFQQIDKARTVFEWGPAPKPGRPRTAGDRRDTHDIHDTHDHEVENP